MGEASGSSQGQPAPRSAVSPGQQRSPLPWGLDGLGPNRPDALWRKSQLPATGRNGQKSTEPTGYLGASSLSFYNFLNWDVQNWLSFFSRSIYLTYLSLSILMNGYHPKQTCELTSDISAQPWCPAPDLGIFLLVIPSHSHCPHRGLDHRACLGFVLP